MKTTMFYLIQVFHQSLQLQMYENNNVYLIQVFHQSLLLQMYETTIVLFNSGVSPIFTIADV